MWNCSLYSSVGTCSSFWDEKLLGALRQSPPAFPSEPLHIPYLSDSRNMSNFLDGLQKVQGLGNTTNPFVDCGLDEGRPGVYSNFRYHVYKELRKWREGLHTVRAARMPQVKSDFYDKSVYRSDSDLPYCNTSNSKYSLSSSNYGWNKT